MAEIKIEIPEKVIEYCERNDIPVQRLVDVALEKYLFVLSYHELTA